MDKSSLSIPEQLSRWLVFLEQWDVALNTGQEVHVLGDLNINHLNWTDPNIPRTNQTTRLKSLITALFTKIFPYGVSQLVTVPTRHVPGQISTGQDHYYSNRPDKLSPVQTQHCGSSDHMLIFATRYSRVVKISPRYIRKRSYKYFNRDQFVTAVREISWLDLYLTSDVNTAVQILSDKITFILDVMAPMRTIQVRTKYAPWLSQKTKELRKNPILI